MERAIPGEKRDNSTDQCNSSLRTYITPSRSQIVKMAMEEKKKKRKEKKENKGPEKGSVRVAGAAAAGMVGQPAPKAHSTKKAKEAETPRPAYPPLPKALPYSSCSLSLPLPTLGLFSFKKWAPTPLDRKLPRCAGRLGTYTAKQKQRPSQAHAAGGRAQVIFIQIELVVRGETSPGTPCTITILGTMRPWCTLYSTVLYVQVRRAQIARIPSILLMQSGPARSRSAATLARRPAVPVEPISTLPEAQTVVQALAPTGAKEKQIVHRVRCPCAAPSPTQTPRPQNQ